MPTTVEIPGVGLVDYPDGMSDEAIAQAAGELHRKALAAQKPAMPALHDVFVQGAGDLIGSPIPGRTPETMGLPTSPEPMSLLTPEQSSQLEGLNRVLENLGSMGDIPGALLNRVMEGASRQVATSGKSALGLEIQPAIDIAQGNLPSLNPAENFARFNKSPLAKAITEGTEEQSKYYNDKFEAMGIGPDLKPIVDFVGNAAGSTLVSIAALPAGLPGLIAFSIGTFAPSFEDALNKGASPNKAFAHAVISTGAETLSEYMWGAPARSAKFLGKMPFLPDAFRKFLDVAPRDALKDAIKEAGMNVFKRLGRTAGMEGLEEVASELAQHVSAAMLYDPTQLTNTTELLTDLFKAFAGGAVSGSLFTPIEAKAAKQMLRSEVAKGIVDQWQQSVDMAKKEGALRPEDEKSIPQAVSARMWMEIGAQRGDAETIARGKAELMRALAPSKGTVTAQEIGNQTEAEVLQAAEINRSLENPATAQQMLAQATEQYGADSGIVERLRAAIERAPVINQGFGMAYGADVAKGEVPSFQRGVPQLGRSKAIVDEKQANADWHKVITNQGYTDDQYELRQGKGYRDNLTDQATDQPSDAKGNPNKEIEGYYDEATKKVVLYQGSIYGGTKRLAEVARHEKLHQAADNPEAQRKIFRFVSEQMPKELAGEVRRLVRLGYRFRDIPEEYLANLYETERWWGEPVDRLRAKLAEWFPKLAPVPPSVAGRILARTLVRSKQEVIPTDESQKEEAGLQVNPQAEGAAGTAQTEAASTTPPAEQPAAPPAAELSTAKEPANQPAPVEVAPVSAPQETPAAKEPPAPVVKESQTTEPEKPTEPVSPPAETAPKTEAAAEPPPETKPEAKAAPSVEEKKEQPATEAFAKTEPPKEGGNENKPATAKTSGRDPIQVAEEIIRADGNTSASLVQLLQSKMLIHYTQAKHLIAELERRGVIDPNRDAIVQAERDAKAKKEQADLQAELDAELGQDSGPFAPGIVESFSKGDFAKAQELADKLPEPGEDWGFKTSDVGNMSGYGSSNPSFTRELKVRSKPLWQWINETGLAPNPAPSKPKTTKKKSSKVPRLSKPEPAPVTPELPPKEQTPDAEPPAVPTPEPTPTVEPPVVAPATATPPTPVPGEAELRATEEAKGKPEASNSRGTSTAKALKVQREYLLAAVTKAIEEAPDEVPIHPDRAEMDAARAAYVEAIKYVPEQTSEQRVAQKLKADADLATRLEPLFAKYGIPTELRYGKQNPDGTMEVVATLLDVFQRETLLSDEVAKAVWRGDNGITFDVPGDGMFTVVNSKPKLKEFLERVEKRFPRGEGVAPSPRMASTSEQSTPAPAKLKTLQDRIKVVAPFASTDKKRKSITRVAHDGNRLIGVDGRQMAIISAGSETKDLKQYDAETGKQVVREADGSDVAEFPNYRQVLPSNPNWRAKINVAAALKMVRGAIKTFENEDKDKTRTVSLLLDEDGNLGVRSEIPDNAAFESGVTDKSQFVGTFDAQYLEDGLVAAAKMGNSDVWFASTDSMAPISMLGSEFAYTLMPMRPVSKLTEQEASVRTKDAIEKSEELTKRWQELTGGTKPSPKSEKPKRGKRQKFSIVDDIPASPSVRESVLEKDEQWLRGEFPGAPNVVYRADEEEGREDGPPIYYDGWGQIVVVTSQVPRSRAQRRGLMLAALHDAGIEKGYIKPEFWQAAWDDVSRVDSALLTDTARALGVDIRDESGRRQVLRRLVEQRMSGPTKYGLVRTLLRMFKAEAPTARVVDRIHAEIEKLSESFIPKTPGEFNPQDPAQVFADKNAATWGLRSFIYGLRDQANQLAYQAIEASQWKRIQDRLNALADQAEAASIGSGRRRFRPDINGSMFMSELSGYGVPFTQADAAAHQTWLEEQEARRVAGRMDSLERNQEVASSLAANFPEYEAEALRATITRQESKLARIEEERPEIYHRANVIRSATEAIPAAKAARDALATPEIADWVETIYQIEQSGVTPRAFDEMGGNLRTDAETAAGMFAHSANTIHGILTERMQESSDKIVRTLRKLHAKRTELRSKQGDADVRVAELMSAIVGDAGASGGLFTREIAEQVRSRELAIGRLAVLLGNASPSTMAAQFREALSSDGEATVDAPVIRHVAADAGITEEVLRDILTLANRDTGFRNAVLMLADEADARASKRVLDVINQIEAVRGNIVGPGPQLPDGPQRAVRAGLLVAREMLGRIRLERSQASATLAEVEKAIEQAEIEQTTIRMLSDLADSAVDMSGGFMSDRIGTAEMVYRTQSNGVHLATFTKADGTTQPAVVFGSGREYTTRMVEDILAWREAALEAARDGTKNPPHVNRGLEIGAQKALEILDAYATPDKILSTAKYQPLNLWLSKQTWAIRQALPRLLPGIHGRAYAEMIAGYARLGRALDDIVAKSHSKRMRLIRSAFESMGLDQYNGIHQAEMAQAYSEIAHRLREHGSTVRVGDTLLSQRLHGTDHGTLTRELLNLIRYDRDIFREAQRVMQSEPYGGIREVLGKLRLVRPAAETGDIGLARRADKMQQRRLAEDYDAEIAVHGKDADLTGLWDKRPDMIRFHILDSTRSDLAFDRNAMIHDLEQQYARDMRSGRVPPPMTIDDTVTQLAAYAGNRIADPLNTIRKAFLGEMAVYARYAKSRTDSKGTSDRPLTGIGTWSGEDDTNEFTSPAAKLVYPSSMYHYGAETTDMRQALANVLDTSQVQVLAAGKAASTALLESVSRISEGPVGTGSMTDEDRAMVLWYNNAKTGTEVTQQMANRAMDRMRQVAAAIDADIKDIQSPTWNAPSLIHKFVGALMPFILTYPRVGISNVFGGPLSTGRILERVVGPQRAFLAMAANTAYSPLFAAYNISDWIIHKATGLNLPRSESTPQTITWLQSIGWSSFFSHAELQAMREHTGGGGIGDAVLRGVVTAGDYLEKTVGRAVGITGTDTHLNRLAASVVVPHVLRQMQRIAIRWQNRLAEANQIAGPDAVGEFAFGTQDSQNADAIREMLRESEVHPEQFLAALANGEIDLRRFYLHPLGAKFGNAVLSDFNAATRTNRPRQRGVLNLLMGWTLYDVSRTVDLLRQPVDRSALKKFMRWSSLGAAMVIGSFYSKVISDFARRGFNEAQTAIAEHIAELLASPPGDDDDLWDWLQNILARLVASFEVHSAPKPMPWEKVWYDRPLLDIAMEVGMAVPGARGLDRLMEGGAVKTPGMGIVFQAAESSVMGVKAVAEALAGKDVEARVDSGAALRAILASFGEYGRVLGNFVVGQPRRESVATIRKAANEAGIPVTPVAMPAGSAVFRATPLRQPLLEAAVGLLDAKPEDATAAKKRLVDVAKAVYQRAYDKVIERGGFSNPIEAKEEADKAGQRAVQSAVSSIEPVTRALGRSVTPDEYVKLKTSGALSNPEVQKETKAVAAAANYLSTIATTGGRSMVNATDSVTSPIRGGGASFGGGLSTGGGGASRSPMGGIGIRRRRLGIARARMPRLRKPKVPKLRSVKMRKPKLPRLR